VLDVERWAELRREHFVRGVGIKELARRHGIDRNTGRRALRADEPRTRWPTRPRSWVGQPPPARAQLPHAQLAQPRTHH
jgi:transposase-like protein